MADKPSHASLGVMDTASGEVTTWTVLYHKGPPGSEFKGRGEFLKLLFEDAGVPYHFSNAHLYGPDSWVDMFRDPSKCGDGSLVKLDNAPYPVVYPPAVWHRPAGQEEEVMINQVNACMSYIGAMLGYAPQSDAERARADCITANAMDYIAAGRNSFHPTDAGGSYHDQKEEGDRVSKEWASTKMPIWLQHFEKLAKRAAGGPIAGGTSVTYADFALFHVLDATEAQFNTLMYGSAWETADTPALKEFKTRFAERPKLKEYFASDRRLPWAGDSMM